MSTKTVLAQDEENNMQEVQWFDICAVEDIPVRGSRRLVLPQINIALFRNLNNEIFAIEDKCPHLGGPLSQGIVHDDAVTCPLHNWVISLRSGEARGADEGCVRTLPVKCEEERVHIQLESISFKAA